MLTVLDAHGVPWDLFAKVKMRMRQVSGGALGLANLSLIHI